MNGSSQTEKEPWRPVFPSLTVATENTEETEMDTCNDGIGFSQCWESLVVFQLDLVLCVPGDYACAVFPSLIVAAENTGETEMDTCDDGIVFSNRLGFARRFPT